MSARHLFAVAVVTAAAVIIASYEARPSGCPAISPTWLNTLEFILGPVSVIAIFAGVVSYGLGRTDDRHRVATVLFALIVAALWAGVGLFIAVAVWLPKGCLG